jgi:hypothetical protein
MRPRTKQMEQTETTEAVLLEETPESIFSIDALLETCLAALTACVWQTCCWPDAADHWTIGDFRFSIVEFEPAPDASLYVQIWSEPHEPVLIEVSSGNWNPGAVKYIWRNQRKALEQRGFRLGGTARNFQKEIVVSSPDDAETLAKEILEICYDVFEYRGKQPLTTTLHRDSRAELQPIHVALTPEDFVKLADQGGFSASVVTGDSDSPLIVMQRGRFRSTAELTSKTSGNLFASVVVRALVRDKSSQPVIFTDEHVTLPVPIRLIADAEGRVMAEMCFMLDGGVTTAWIVNRLARWKAAVRACQRLLAKRHVNLSDRGARKRSLSVH